MTERDDLEYAIRLAYARATNPGVRRALDDALRELDAVTPPDALTECPDCHKVGLPARIDDRLCCD